MDVPTDRRLNDTNNSVSSVPGTENSSESSKKPTSSSKESSSRSKRRDSRSKSPRSRRHRSKSRSFSPSNRGRQRDPRLRGRRSRSPNRGPRSPPRSRKSGSRDRYRSSRRNWSPRKKGPVSPPPIQSGNPFNMPPPQMAYSDGYNYPQSYAPPPAPYASYDYSMQTQAPFNSYPNAGVMQPVPPGDDFQQSGWGHQSHMAIPPPTLVIPPPIQKPVETEEEKQKREAAVAKELKTQRATLGKQREDYKRRAAALKRELNTLKEQRDDLTSGEEPPSPTTKGFIKENDRLQLQIENKITSIENVIDMLTNIIGTKDSTPTPSPPPPPTPVKSKKDKDKKKKSNDSSDDDSSPERLKNKALESLKKKKANDLKVAELRNDDDVNVMSVDDKYKCTQKINYVHYDPQMHWCKQCNIFPKTAKDFLIHLHSKEHQDTQKIIEPPWHDKQTNDEMPNYPDAPTKRTPIRGLQFFVPTTGWYCTICSIWMGDLHCASLHLKSQTHAKNYNDYNNLNPHFEVDWMGERHKAYEESRQKTPLAIADRPSLQQPAQIVPIPMPVPPPSLTMEQEVIEGIPLQLQIPTTHKLDLDEGKKKKKKKKSDEKKEKKKKKRSKKRRQSSSSSSSSDSSDSEANTPAEKSREDTSHSIRVAMRNLLKQQSEKKLEDSGGKWTVVQPAQVAEPAPPPPTISTNGENDNRRDDLMISQWNNPEPIITEDEKKLFEQLKGRLKANSKEREVNGRKRSKERSKEPKERNESRERDRDRDRDRERNRRRRSRSRSQSRNKRSRSRDRRRSRSRERRRSRSRSRGRFRSRSRSTGRWGRRWSRSRSRSRGGRVEKPIVRYPEFRPRVPEKESEKLDRKKGEKKREQDEPKNGGSASRTDSKKTVIVLKNPNTNKKLPFIGRMPVFKRQANEEEVKKPETVTESVPNPNYHSTYYEGSTNVPPQMPMEDYDDLMPDPMQFVSLMGSAPPPPPMVPPPPSTVDKNEPVLPPGIDEADADLVRKTISDAPLPRKGPLPQDFQDALSIIFDQKPIPDPETDKINLPEPNCEAESQIIPMQIVDEQSQHTIDLYQASFPLTGLKPDADLSFAEDVDIPEPMPLAIPPPPPPPTHEEVSKSIEMVDEDPIVAAKKLEDSALMDDLAMLGIDASDLAAQCI